MATSDRSRQRIHITTRKARKHVDNIEPVMTAELPTVLAENVSYGKSGIAGLTGSPYVLLASFLASLGGFSFGYDQGVISIINVMPQFLEAFPRLDPENSSAAFWKGLNTAVLELGCVTGCIFMPWLCDKISRKWAITVVVCFFCVGGIIQTAAANYGMLAFGRFFGGIGVGTLALGAPLAPYTSAKYHLQICVVHSWFSNPSASSRA